MSETPGVGEPPENPQQKKGSSGGLGTKRKLEEDEGLVNDETNDVIGDRKSHEDENVEEEEEGGHARKKSKTNGEAVSSIPDE